MSARQGEYGAYAVSAFRALALKSVFALFLFLALPAHAQDAEEIDRPDEPGGLHSVWIYKQVCYDPMPDTAAVEKMAEEFGFTPMEEDDLSAFAPGTDYSYLKGWQVSDHDRVFSTAISIAPVDEQLAESYPDFAGGTATGCTVILPTEDETDAVADGMNRLIGREAEETYEAGPFIVSAWSGSTEENVFLVYHYKSKSGDPGGLLSIVTLSK